MSIFEFEDYPVGMARPLLTILFLSTVFAQSLLAGFRVELSETSNAVELFKPLRQPVLGLVIEWNERLDLYRLVSVEGERTELVKGSLENCESKLVEVLEARYGEGRPNLPFPTFGGVQFWTDVFWYADWRIQINVYTGHHRLLDPQDRRQAWGSREVCRSRFESARRDLKLQLESDHLVVLLHGLGRSRKAFEVLHAKLASAGYAVASVGYPSTRLSIDEHADGLVTVLEGLDDVSRVSFVTHSLGGIIVRAALARNEASWRSRMELGRVVMLAPPNRGSELARELSAFSPFRLLAGPSAQELRAELKDLPAPPCPFGIVAAARTGDGGWNPFIEGDDDGIVSVAETRLEGAADFLRVKGVHTLIMNDPNVIAATIRFLKQGRFLAEESER